MSKRVRYRMDNKSFGRFILSDQAMKPTMKVGRAIMRRAEQIAPRSGDGQRIPYADQFDLAPKPTGITAGKYQNPRVAVEVINRAGHAPIVEYGAALDSGRTQRAHRTLLRAGTMYGDSGINVEGGR